MYSLWLLWQQINKMENERSIRRLMDEEAKDYINRHKILELFKNMTALLLYYQPGNVT